MQPLNFKVVANSMLEWVSDDGVVLDRQEGHNIILSGGIDWITRRVWGGLSGTSQPAELEIANFAILLGDGGGAVYVPTATDTVLKGATTAAISGDSLTVDDTLPANNVMTFRGVTPVTNVPFHVREMGLAIRETGGPQTVNSVTYRLINLLSGPPNRDYTGLSAGDARATIAFRLVSSG